MFTWLGTWLFNPFMTLGAVAVASPILIHILSKRRFRRVRWAAIDFLLAAHQQNRRRVQTEQLILLALRCLAILLLALCLARPFLRPGLAATLLGGAPRTERIVVLDDSYSMQYTTVGRATFADAQASLLSLVEWVAQESPEDSFTVLRTSNPAEPVVAVSNVGAAAAEELRVAVRGMTPSARTAQMDRAIRAAALLAGRRARQANTSVYVISDMQRSDWTAVGAPPVQAAEDGESGVDPATTDEPARSSPDGPSESAANAQPESESGATATEPRSVIAPLADLARAHHAIDLYLIDVSADAPENIAVTAVEPARAQVVSGVPTRVVIEVANHTDHDIRDITLSIAAADQAMPSVTIAHIPARRSVREPVEVTFPRAGGNMLSVALAGTSADDAAAAGLMIDDRRAWCGPVLDAVRILIVNGDPSYDAYRDEVYLLSTALRPEGTTFSGNDLRIVEDTELDDLDLSGFHVVFLANVFRLSPAALRSLEAFTKAGGGIVMSVGDQIDAALANESLYAGGAGLLPARLTETVTASSMVEGGGYVPAAWRESHPIFRSFAGPAAELLRRIRFARFFGVDLAGATNAPASASQPAAESARVLASLSDPEQSPLLIERAFGAGRVLLFTSTIDLDWNTWARDPSFVPFVLELATYAARPPRVEGTVLPGDVIRTVVDPNAYEPRVTMLPPGDAGEPVGIDARQIDGVGLVAMWRETGSVGVFRRAMKRTSGVEDIDYVAVNPDPAEGDLTPMNAQELRDTLPEMPFEYMTELSALSGDAVAARRELWWPLLLAAIAVLMSEHALAWWFGAKGR